MSGGKVLLQTQGDIAHIVLNRPEKRNALDRETWTEIGQAVQRIEEDFSIRAAILTGAGKAFSAGLDLASSSILQGSMERGEGAPSQEALQRRSLYAVIKPLQAIFTRLAECRVPVIAAVHGAAAGAGMELALCADIRVAAEDAELWIPEVRYGLVPDMGGTQRLARLVGPSRAKELIFTGKKVSAERALALGLVDHLVPRGEDVKRAEELAREIADQAPLAVQAAKRAVNASMEMGLSQGLDAEAREAASCLPTEDVFEGFLAAMEKRAPRFRGA